MRCGTRVLAAAAWLLLGGQASAVTPVEIVPLGGVPDALATSGAYELSGDGSMAVGWARRTASGPQIAQAWRLLPALERIDLGDLPGGIEQSTAQSVSADGRVISGPGTTEFGQQAWRWTAETGLVSLPFLPGDDNNYVNAVSDDGDFLCGYSAGFGRREATVWGPDATPVGLGDLPGGVFNSYAGDCTANARVVVGAANDGTGNVAFRWTEETGMVNIGDLAFGTTEAHALAVSADGTVVAGWSVSLWGEEGFIWTATEGMRPTGDLPGGAFDSWMFDLSSDGSLALGYGTTEQGKTGALWDGRHGLRSLVKVLEDDYGADMTGWSFYLARGISEDGRIITARAHTPWGTDEVVAVRLPPPCDDGVDNDGDGTVDLADPACRDVNGSETSLCQDGVDNDHDGRIDFDGGASQSGGVPLTLPDPRCTAGWKNSEALTCGLGVELVFVASIGACLRRRMERARR